MKKSGWEMGCAMTLQIHLFANLIKVIAALTSLTLLRNFAQFAFALERIGH
jgi:hypothetical protein